VGEREGVTLELWVEEKLRGGEDVGEAVGGSTVCEETEEAETETVGEVEGLTLAVLGRVGEASVERLGKLLTVGLEDEGMESVGMGEGEVDALGEPEAVWGEGVEEGEAAPLPVGA